MTKASHERTARWAELSDDVLESVEASRKSAIEAVHKFVDDVTPAVAEHSRRKAIVDTALDLAEELVTVQIEFARSVVRSAGYALSNEGKVSQ